MSSLHQVLTSPRSCLRASQLCVSIRPAPSAATFLTGDRIIGLLELLKQLGLVSSGDAGTGAPDKWNDPSVGGGFDDHFAGIGDFLTALPTRSMRTCVKRRPSPRPGGKFGGKPELETRAFYQCEIQCAGDGLGNVLNRVIGELQYKSRART